MKLFHCPQVFLVGSLVQFVDFAELLQKLWIAVIEAHNFPELRTVPLFMFNDFAPDFDFTE